MDSWTERPTWVLIVRGPAGPGRAGLGCYSYQHGNIFYLLMHRFFDITMRFVKMLERGPVALQFVSAVGLVKFELAWARIKDRRQQHGD